MELCDFFLVDEALPVLVLAVEALEEVIHDFVVELKEVVGAARHVLAEEEV